MRVLCLLLLAVLLVRAKAPPDVSDDDDGAAVVDTIKACSEKLKPTEDDMNDISEGKLESSTSRAMITCLFQGTEVMKGKEFHKENAVEFLKVLVPGGEDDDKLEQFKKLSERCAPKVASTRPKDTSTEEQTAVAIYDCLVVEGRKMGLAMDGEDTKDKKKT